MNNDDDVAPGRGFGTHPHRDMKIVTWVLRCELEHRDSERNASATNDLRLVQMWVLPDEKGIRRGYEEADVTDILRGAGHCLNARAISIARRRFSGR